MKTTEFNELVEQRCSKIKDVLANKAKEYAREDRLHNFKVAARINDSSPEKALKGMLLKHIVSVFDIIDDIDQDIIAEPYLVNEKIGDSINYLILLEALLYEREMNKNGQ